MNNQTFCYWLQGYFEIAQSIQLTEREISIIEEMLAKITESLEDFTAWLRDLCLYFRKVEFNEKILAFFCVEIQMRLNAVFYHVIDPTYDAIIDRTLALQIHHGELE